MNLYQQLVAEGIVQYKVADDPVIETVDLHTAGEPLRVILRGFPEINAKGVLAARSYCREYLDDYRKALMHEPRGHHDMYGCLIIPPDLPDSDFGVLFLHNEGYSTMCGHAVIALTQLAYEHKWKSSGANQFSLKIDAPCGQIRSWIDESAGTNPSVSFLGVPSFVVGKKKTVRLNDGTSVPYQLAYGGAFYAYVDADGIELDLRNMTPEQIRSLGMEIKTLVMTHDCEIVHPVESDLSFLYGTIFTSQHSEKADSFNVCIFADGELDRCPTGSGLSGRMAIEFKERRLGLTEAISVESISGGVYTAAPMEKLEYHGLEAVVPRISGRAYITGTHRFLVSRQDPLRTGFLI